MRNLACPLVVQSPKLKDWSVLLSSVIENVPTSIVVKEPAEGRFVLVNQAAEKLFGIPRTRMLGKNDQDLFPPEAAARLLALDREALKSEHQLLSPGHLFGLDDGDRRFVSTMRFAIRGDDGEPRFLVGVIEDITACRRAEDDLTHIAHHDVLTGLANRIQLRESLARSLGGIQQGRPIAVLCIGLDHLKGVNEMMGYPSGDVLLRLVAERLRWCVPDHDSISRLGGDEFAIVQYVEDRKSAGALADCVIAAIGRPFDVEGCVLTVGASIGIAIGPEDGRDPDLLLKNAGLAMCRAKIEGRGTYRLLEPAIDVALRARHAVEADLQAALANQEFELFYQPSFDLETNEIRGVEALLRWRHPVRGTVSPTEFIPIAEEMGLIVSLGAWVLERACQDTVAWGSDVKVALNLSPLQFKGRTLLSSVARALCPACLLTGWKWKLPRRFSCRRTITTSPCCITCAPWG